MVKEKCLGIKTRSYLRRKRKQNEIKSTGVKVNLGNERYYFLLSLEEKMKRLNIEMEMRSRWMYRMALTQ